MGAAAEWADITPFARRAGDDRLLAALSVSTLSWAQQHESVTPAPLFGGRRTWVGYAFETTGYGSLELCGPLAYRVTIVHPDDREALRQHHRLVRRGRLRPAPYRRRLGDSRLRVIEREQLTRSRADTHGSWLFAAQRIARVCGTDDEVARIAGPALRQLLWVSRDHLDSRHVEAAFVELARATEDLATERRRYRAAVDRWVAAGHRSELQAEAHLGAVRQLVQGDLDSIRLETGVLAEVRRVLTDR
ncbi:MAG: hypothetical protein JWR55_506 [Aeromicrobium sp.]|jgi:hypothetical protein|nr:hypothetical protein [Aeromicrobium sp.]